MGASAKGFLNVSVSGKLHLGPKAPFMAQDFDNAQMGEKSLVMLYHPKIIGLIECGMMFQLEGQPVDDSLQSCQYVI